MAAVYELKIAERDVDRLGHVNNAAYLALFEEARWDLITRNGYGFDTIQRTRRGPVVLSVEMEWKREVRARDQVRIETRCLEYKGRTGLLEQVMLTPEGKPACRAVFKFALFDLDRRRIVSPTPEWRHAVGL